MVGRLSLNRTIYEWILDVLPDMTGRVVEDLTWDY